MPTTVNIHEAKTQLSRLIARAASGESIVIAKAGKPLARLVPLAERDATARLGFLKGRAVISADLKKAFAQDIETMFDGR